MRRFLYLFAILAIIVAGSLIYQYRRQYRWRTLPGVGEMRLMAVTYEKSPAIRIPLGEFDWSNILRSLRTRRWLHSTEEGVALPESKLAIWFLTRPDNDTSIFNGDGCEIVLPGSEVIRGRKLRRTLGGRGYLDYAIFDSAPRDQWRLHIRAGKDGHMLEYDIWNPSYSLAARQAP